MGLIAILGGVRATAFAALAVVALILAGVLSHKLRGAAETISAMTLQAAQDKAALAEARVEASEEARLKEIMAARAANAVADAYERGKQDAQAAGDRVAADLRAGNVRLQDRWRGCEAGRVSTIAGASGEPDASAADRNDSAGRIIGAGAACDAQVIGLQQFILSERQ